MSDVITYGDHEINVKSLPEVSVHALLRRGLSHFLGNEQASKVTAWAKRFEEENKREATEEEKAKAKADYIAAALTALNEGTVGNVVRGPKVDPITARVQKLAKKEVLDILKAQSIKAPKGDEVITFGNGETRTMEQMVSKRIELHGERFAKEAKKQLDAEAKKAEAVKETVASVGDNATAEALGL
jgi:hypothetical protein